MADKLLYLDSSSFTTKGVIPEEGETIDSIIIEGFANTSDKDRADDVIPASAWEDGIKEYQKNPVILAYHDHGNPVGRMVEHEIRPTGLWIKARISAASEKVFNLVKDGIITAFSVGFSIKDAEYKPEIDTFIIKELELHEISLVSVGMNREALFSLSKSFSNDEEFNKFKLKFASANDITKGLEIAQAEDQPTHNNKEILDMDPKELEKLVAQATAKALAERDEKLAKEKEDADKLAASEKSLEDRIAEAVKAATKADNDPVPATTKVEVGESGASKLLADIEERFANAEESNKNLLEGLQAELKEKALEIQALQKSKMTFAEPGTSAVSYQEKENAVILSKILRKSVEDTKYGAGLVEKVGGHVASATWELEVSLNMENEVRQRLVIAPTMRNISMKTNVMTIPVNPEAGLATWVTNAQFGTTASTGPEVTHQLGEITLNAYKVATLDYLDYEEEEDSLIVLMPIIRDGMIRRVARSVDIAFLRGAGAGTDPVKGLTTYDAVSATTLAVANDVTVAHMLAMREDLGKWGLDPSQLIYAVSSEVYYDLLKDTTFQTTDKVGDKATLLTGQIGSIGNTPVLVSSEFEPKAANTIGATIYAPANFIVGNQRGLRFETDRLIETQRQALVASLRTGLVQTTTNQGMGVSNFSWVA